MSIEYESVRGIRPKRLGNLQPWRGSPNQQRALRRVYLSCFRRLARRAQGDGHLIVGGGLLAHAFAKGFGDRRDVIIFASGVSNSGETRSYAFQRERSLLESVTPSEQLTVYFSTCSIDDPSLRDSPYIRHKMAMEALIAARSPHWAVFRLPQVVGRTPNPHTLTNYLHRKIVTGEHLHVWTQATRNLIDADHVAVIAKHLLDKKAFTNCVINIASPFSIAVPELVHIFERVLGRRGNCALVAAGCSYPIDVEIAKSAAIEAGIPFGMCCTEYVTSLIQKYYEPEA